MSGGKKLVMTLKGKTNHYNVKFLRGYGFSMINVLYLKILKSQKFTVYFHLSDRRSSKNLEIDVIISDCT